MLELMVAADVPPSVVSFVTGAASTAGAALIAHPQVDKVAFTGSTEVGNDIIAASRDTLRA